MKSSLLALTSSLLALALSLASAAPTPPGQAANPPAPVAVLKTPNANPAPIPTPADPDLVGALAKPGPAGKPSPKFELTEAQYAALTNAIERLAELVQKGWNLEHANASGRRRWHGKRTASVVDTNALVKTEIYEDGYQWCAAWQPAPSPAVAQDPEAALKRRLAEIDADPTMPEAVKEVERRRAIAASGKPAEVTVTTSR